MIGGAVDLATLGFRLFLDVDLDGASVSKGDSCGESREEISITPDSR